jgi:hypothetical protein
MEDLFDLGDRPVGACSGHAGEKLPAAPNFSFTDA